MPWNPIIDPLENVYPEDTYKGLYSGTKVIY